MVVHSAGILAYKYLNGKLMVMLSHPGGPFWAKKDNGSWSIPKGIVEEGEEIMAAAKREFEEETSYKIEGELTELGTLKQPSKKLIAIFAINMDIDTSKVRSNMFEMEWPPKSGKMQEFPENDKAEWFLIEEARLKILKGQMGFLDKLIEKLDYNEEKETVKENEYKQLSLFD